MQTMAPPDEALIKERFARIDERFDEVNRRVTEGQKETNRRFDEVNRRITEGKEEMHRSFDSQATETKALRQEMTSLNASVHRGNYATFAAMLGVIAAILAKGG
jgi:ribulose 1,5-bisphosphate carboxylase large subunit-like protein